MLPNLILGRAAPWILKQHFSTHRSGVVWKGQRLRAPKPPYMLVQLGLMNPRHRWVVRKALYGLQSSPADWASYRDKELQKLQISSPACATLCQSVTDSSMWFLKDSEGTLHAIMTVYVDDLAIFAEKKVADSLVSLIRGLWKTSEPEWADIGCPRDGSVALVSDSLAP